jgi:radical SAM-linked protein
MNSIRVRFVRGNEVKFISHLDLMKVFERALRRSRLPIAYSQGFNPHPQMVFGLPLSVGVTSSCEYADFELSYELAAEDFTARLNMQLPKGLHITRAGQIGTKNNIMKSVAAAAYNVLTDAGNDISIDACPLLIFSCIYIV